jgi:hypothetical protein
VSSVLLVAHQLGILKGLCVEPIEAGIVAMVRAASGKEGHK